MAENTENSELLWCTGGPELVVLPPGTQIPPSSPAPTSPSIKITVNIKRRDPAEILEIIGSGFVPGIPGIYGNTTISATPEDDSTPDIEPSPLITEQSPDLTPRQAKAKATKNTQE